MKQGDELQCQYCKKNTFIVKKTIMDGWTKLGEAFVCSSCDAKIADIDEDNIDVDMQSLQSSSLADFLGVEEEKKKVLSFTEDEGHFCRDCDNLVVHPFLIKCELHDKNVDPMGDCPDFVKRISEKN